MSLRNFYKLNTIVGLRSNPKFCEVDYQYPYLLVKCGFKCVHYAEKRLDKRSEYQAARDAAIKEVIASHDEWMKAVKRNRIGEGVTRTQPVRPSFVWRQTQRPVARAVQPRRAQAYTINFS